MSEIKLYPEDDGSYKLDICNVFTDEDLKMLRMACQYDLEAKVGAKATQFLALIARLEAAEKVIGLVEDCTEECSGAIDAWYKTRKEAGK